MLGIKYTDAKICINCGTLYDKKLEQSYGKDICPQCGEKMGVTIGKYIAIMNEKEVCHET